VKGKINIKYYNCVIIAFICRARNENGPYSHLWSVWLYDFIVHLWSEFSYDIIVHNYIHAQFSEKFLFYMKFVF